MHHFKINTLILEKYLIPTIWLCALVKVKVASSVPTRFAIFQIFFQSIYADDDEQSNLEEKSSQKTSSFRC